MLGYELLMSLCVGGAVASLAWLVLSMIYAPRVISSTLGRFEEGRRQQLRDASTTYKMTEPWVDELIAFRAGTTTGMIATLRDNLPGTGDQTPWRPEEYLATRQVEGLLVGVSSFVVTSSLWSSTMALFASVMIGAGYVWLMVNEIKGKAKKRRDKIRRRFAPTFDLVSLMLGVGSSFQEALATVAEEAEGHPLGQELGRMLQDTELGGIRGDAIQAFSDRIADDDIGEMMAGIVEAEKLGSPIADVMQTQVEQMRQKRSQWAELAAEESKVKLVFPAMIIMLACLVIVAAPFILDAVLSS